MTTVDRTALKTASLSAAKMEKLSVVAKALMLASLTVVQLAKRSDLVYMPMMHLVLL